MVKHTHSVKDTAQAIYKRWKKSRGYSVSDLIIIFVPNEGDQNRALFQFVRRSIYDIIDLIPEFKPYGERALGDFMASLQNETECEDYLNELKKNVKK